jgi:hypothetical protein
MIQGALQQWLGELIRVDGVEVQSVDATLSITVRYTVRRTQETREANFSKERS